MLYGFPKHFIKLGTWKFDAVSKSTQLHGSDWCFRTMYHNSMLLYKYVLGFLIQFGRCNGFAIFGRSEIRNLKSCTLVTYDQNNYLN